MSNGFEWGLRVIPGVRLASELYEGTGEASGEAVIASPIGRSNPVARVLGRVIRENGLAG
jgi:hypothetical protein